MAMLMSYCVDADELERVKPGDHKSLTDHKHYHVRQRVPDEYLNTVRVHLRGQAKHHDGRLEGDEQRQGGRYDAETSVSHDELFRSTLASTGQRMIDADAERDRQKCRQNHVVRPLQLCTHARRHTSTTVASLDQRSSL